MDNLTLQNYLNRSELQADIEAAARQARARAMTSLLNQVWHALRGS
jgi:hypothetical protein